jgi:hypothetical protein
VSEARRGGQGRDGSCRPPASGRTGARRTSLQIPAPELVRRLDDDFAKTPARKGHAEETLLIVVRDTDCHLARSNFSILCDNLRVESIRTQIVRVPSRESSSRYSQFGTGEEWQRSAACPESAQTRA